MRRLIAPTQLIIHCADTPNGRPVTAREIDRWHAARFDMRQRDEESLLLNFPQYPYCGYHGIIYIDGTLERTRAENEIGSHCSGQNSHSLGFCLVGTDKFTPAQWDTLAWLVNDCKHRWGPLTVTGHRTYNAGKTCPGFSVEDWIHAGLGRLEAHTLL